jgi:hypothetical protein
MTAMVPVSSGTPSVSNSERWEPIWADRQVRGRQHLGHEFWSLVVRREPSHEFGYAQLGPEADKQDMGGEYRTSGNGSPDVTRPTRMSSFWNSALFRHGNRLMLNKYMSDDQGVYAPTFLDRRLVQGDR